VITEVTDAERDNQEAGLAEQENYSRIALPYRRAAKDAQP